ACGARMTAPAILIVDDDDVFRERLARALRDRGHEVATAADAAAALAEARRRPFAYAVADLRMPGASGLELVAALKELDAAMRVVVLTGYGSIVSVVEAMRLGAHSYLSKPADADEALAALTGWRPSRGRAGARRRRRKRARSSRPAWRAPSGSTSSASWPTATATSRSRPAGWGSRGGRCSSSSRSTRPACDVSAAKILSRRRR